MIRRGFVPVFVLALSLSLGSLMAKAEDTVPPETGQPLETVEVNPNMPVIPITVERPINTDGMSLDEAKQALKSLSDAQTKMMQQMQMLQARIEKTEEQQQAAQQQMMTNAQQTKSNTSTLDALAKRVHISGAVEMGWRVYSHGPRTEEFLDADNQNSNTFDVRRVELYPQVTFTDKASWLGEIEFEDAGEDEISVEQSVFNYAWKPWMNVHGGLMVLPYTETSLNHDGYQRLLVDRPLMDFYIIPTTYRDLGVGLTGAVPVSKHNAASYEVDVVNGLQDTLAPDNIIAMATAHDFEPVSSSVDFAGLHDASPAEGNANTRWRDNNANKEIFGHVSYEPLPGLELGLSASTGKIDPQNRELLSIVAGDLQYRYKKFSLLGEYATDLFGHARGFNEQGVPFSQFPTRMGGYFVQAAYDLNPKWTSIAAYNYVNLDTSHSGNIMQRLSLGLRYNPFQNVYLKTEYQCTLPRTQFPSSERVSNAVLTQLTFFFQ